MPRSFAILLHRTNEGVHYDFLLEQEDALAAFRLPTAPANLPDGAEIEVPRLSDHRKAYLAYEGEVIGGRGSVTRIDSGTYEDVFRDDARWVVRLSGRHAAGEVELRPLGGDRFGFTWRPSP